MLDKVSTPPPGPTDPCPVRAGRHFSHRKLPPGPMDGGPAGEVARAQESQGTAS